MRDKRNDYLYSADPLSIDTSNDILGTRLKKKISLNDDHIMNDQNTRKKLVMHYDSILDCLQDKGGKAKEKVMSPWTLRIDDSEGDPTLIAENFDACKADLAYLNYGKLERQKRSLSEKREKWIEEYMLHMRVNTDTELRKLVEVSDIDEKEVEEMEILLIDELQEMMWMFIKESQVWEYELWKKHQEMMASNADNMQTQLVRNLPKDWQKNLYMRNTRERQSIHERLKKEKDRLDFRMTVASKRGVDEIQAKQRFHELVLQMDAICQGVYSTSDYTKPTDFSKSEFSSILTDSLNKQTSNMNNRLNTMTSNSNISKALESRCKARRENMKYRIFNELKDIEDRIQQKIVSCNDELSVSK